MKKKYDDLKLLVKIIQCNKFQVGSECVMYHKIYVLQNIRKIINFIFEISMKYVFVPLQANNKTLIYYNK